MFGPRRSVLSALSVLLLLAATTLSAQRPQTREGFWLNIGAGYATLGCNNCNGREEGGAGTISLGGTLSQKWQLGANVSAWTKDQSGVNWTVGLVSGVAKFYPSATGGFFLQAGAGVAAVDITVNNVTGTKKGVGSMLGAGYDIRIGRNVSLTPFWNRVQTWYNDFDDDLDFSQFGLSITIH